MIRIPVRRFATGTMRHLKLQMQISVDGFSARTNGDESWMVQKWDQKLLDHANQLASNLDCILLGHKYAESFIPYWNGETAKENKPAFANKMRTTTKLVFCEEHKGSTNVSEDWEKTKFADDTIENEVKKLKKEQGGDMIMYGGVPYANKLIKENLVDEYHLFVNPVCLGQGKSIFEGIGETRKLKLDSAQPFDCGIVALCYKPSQN